MKFILSLLFSLLITIANAQPQTLTKQQVQQDIEFLKRTLNEKSSYAYLNGYDFNKDFDDYLSTIDDSTRLEDFGLFITEILAKIGDRHSSLNTIRGFSLNETRFLPFIYAPINNKVAVLTSNENKEFELLSTNFPYLKEIDGIYINDFILNTRPEDIKAPSDTYFTMAVRDIRDIQKNYKLLNKSLPEEITLILSDSTFKKDTTLVVPVIDKSKRSRPWDEKFEVEYIRIKDEDYNNPEVFEKLFSIDENIAYIKIPEMTSIDETPLLFDKLNSFMKSVRHNSKALIIDVRSNSGGTRDLMYEFANYLIHPDSVYVINATKQRGSDPLPKESIENLNSRFLFPFSELDSREQKSVSTFMETFKPIYELDDQKYSEYYFGLFNGQKLESQSFYYNKPIYILANEKTFSAASVFVSAFKGIPNIQIVGVTTDGSSGNSEWFDLPQSELFGKISTMVSFQKDGKILDGYGTEPDIEIQRNMNQVLWKSDYQLEKLRSIILNKD